jgi:hypothetical protein
VRRSCPPESCYFVASFAASVVLSMALSIFSPAFSAGPFSGQALVARATADRATTMMMLRTIFMPLTMPDFTGERLSHSAHQQSRLELQGEDDARADLAGSMKLPMKLPW